MIKKLWKDEDGLTTVEYALLLALLVVAAIGVWTAFGGRVKQSVQRSTNSFDNAEGA
jgi:Flp pilus assembly pilin Flp